MARMTLQEVVSFLPSRSRVFIHGAAATPSHLLEAMVQRARTQMPPLQDVETVHLHLEGAAPHTGADVSHVFRPNGFFCAANMRKAVAEQRADYTPVFLSEVPNLFRRGIVPVDAAMLHVSPPDRHGYVSLGVSVDVAFAAAQTAKVLIAQVNPNMPRTLGDGALKLNDFNAWTEVEAPLPEVLCPASTSTEIEIGKHIAALVEDGATLQLGIGTIPNAVTEALATHRDLGLHTEMFSDGVLTLLEKGVVTNARKPRQRGKTVTSFVMGSRAVYDFIDDNPCVEVRDSSYVNDTYIIAQMPKMTAINGAIEVDITGQVVSDSIGEMIYSGVGGQMDFVRGATLSEGGKAIIALPSQTSKGQSRIVSQVQAGAGVVTTRAHVHYVVTEFGTADLYAKPLRDRAKALIQIAHPSHRETLEREAHRRFGR